ncbi:MAG: deoxyguanosinetriphosphate triphosphohydrolase [Actinomycetota bacterium]
MEHRIRLETEDLEDRALAPRACRAATSRGRDREEPQDPIRTVYQRDRDRIVHSKAFRRLAHKTQVFLAPEGDHYRVRLTHTLEVTQVARTIARALRLNEDLVEAICLGHDLGHTPFGHLGEEVVASFSPGFKHNLQSVRIVEVLEDLNLTWEVRDGIARHSKGKHGLPVGAPPELRASTIEGQVARVADIIAYVNHDIDDAIRAGLLTEGDLPAQTRDVLGASHNVRINRMVGDLVEASSDADEIRMTEPVFEAMATTRDFLFERVYLGRIGEATRSSVEHVLTSLLEYYSDNPIPEGSARDGNPKQDAVDYVAGMTDRFALRSFETLMAAPAPDLTVLG